MSLDAGPLPAANLEDHAERVIRAYDAGQLQALPPVRLLYRLACLERIVHCNRIDVAKAYAEGAGAAYSPGAAPTLLTLLQALPADFAGAPGDGFVDAADSDVQIVSGAPGAPMLVVVCGNAHRFGADLNLMHCWLRRLHVNLVYLRDFRRLFYLCGVRSVGDYGETVSALRRIAADLGASRIACIGNSGGAYGALRLGLDLGAEAVAALSGPTSLHRLAPKLRAIAESQGVALPEEEIERSSLPDLYAAARGRTPLVRLVYGAESHLDRAHAMAMGRLPGVALMEIPGWKNHAVLGPLVALGLFDRLLRWAIGGSHARADQMGASPSPK